jgi:hypothetical protein
MQGYHSAVEMYRDTTERMIGIYRKKWSQCQKNMGMVINHLRCTKKTKTEKWVGRQWNKKHTMRYIRNKGNEHLDMIDKQRLTLALR